jgi:hypothetical protein
MAAAVGAGAGQPNKDDYQVKRIRRSLRVGFVASIVSAWDGQTHLEFELYVQDHPPFGTPYALYGTYFYTVQPKNPKHWRELAGIRVELAIPDTPRLPPAQAAEFVRTALRDEFAFYASRPCPPPTSPPTSASPSVAPAPASTPSPRRWTTWRPTRTRACG